MVFNNLFFNKKVDGPEKSLKVIVPVYKKLGIDKYGKIENQSCNKNDKKGKIFVFAKVHYQKFTTFAKLLV